MLAEDTCLPEAFSLGYAGIVHYSQVKCIMLICVEFRYVLCLVQSRDTNWGECINVPCCTNNLYGGITKITSSYYITDFDTLISHRCQHGLRKMRDSARNDISRTHANFACAHKCEQNTTYPYTLSHFIKWRLFWQITHLIVNCNMVLSWGWGI